MTASWQLGPVVRGMRGHRAAAALVVAQLAIALAITVLAALLADYFVRVNDQPSSVDEAELTLVELQVARAAEIEARTAEALATIRATPGCAAVAEVRLALGAIEPSHDQLRRAEGEPTIAVHEVAAGAGLAVAAGLELRAGRDLVDEDMRAAGPVAALVTERLARRLWPGVDPIGAAFVSRAHGAAVVVGVAAEPRSRLLGRGERAVIYAGAPRSRHVQLLVRSAGPADDLRAALRERLAGPGRHVEVAPLYQHERNAPVDAVLGVLAAMVGAIVIVMLTGSMGLTYFLVARRTRDIGLRRAMGATRRDVVLDLVVENALYTAAGALLGLAIVFAVVPTLTSTQEGFTVRWSLVAVTVVAVVALNLLATLIPAARAAAVPPAVASRSA